MRQEVTRAHKGWALDSVTLHNDVTRAFREEITSSPPVSWNGWMDGWIDERMDGLMTEGWTMNG